MSLVAADSRQDIQDGIGRIGRIPVRNLWLLMLYASHLFKALENAKVLVEDNPDDIPDLVAEILCRQVERRMQRNLSYGFRSREAVVARVRGHIDILKTERCRLLDRGKIACEFDELSIDSVKNRFVRDALGVASKIVCDRDLVHRCRSLSGSLRKMGVVGERPGRREVFAVRYDRHEVDDQAMISAALLIFDLALPTEAEGMVHLPSPDREITWIRKLYEKGIAGFYDVVLAGRGWVVQPGKTLAWPIDGQSTRIEAILPGMRTDIVMDHLGSQRRIVIDTKFNSITTGGWYREETLRSGYIFQIYAYLRSQEGNGDPLSEKAAGILLHPSVGERVNEAVVIQNHEIRFATVDLGAKAREVRKQLMEIIEVPLA